MGIERFPNGAGAEREPRAEPFPQGVLGRAEDRGNTMMGHYSIRNRIWMIVVIVVVSAILGGVVDISVLRRSLWQEKELQIRQHVESGLGVLAYYHKLQLSGKLSEAAAQAAAISTIRAMRYGETDYLWLNDSSAPFPKMVMHPAMPELDGQVLDAEAYNCATSFRTGSDDAFTRTDGRKNLFVAGVEVTRSGGAGYVTYRWPKPKAGGGATATTYPKLSYVKKFDAWGWIVGSGTYVDDVNDTAQAQATLSMLLVAGTTVVLLLIASAVARGIVQPLHAAVTTMRAIGKGDKGLVHRLPTDGPSEIAELSHGFNDMLGRLQVRELEVQRQREILEGEVERRTVDLHMANQHLLGELAERNRAQREKDETEKTYQSLFDNMLNGVAYCRMSCENGHPIDIVFLSVNGAFESLTGLKNVVGRRITEVMPGLRESDPALFETFSRVALGGTPETFEMYVSHLQMWFSMSVYCPRTEHFIAFFDVITKRKRFEQDLARERSFLKSLIGTLPDLVWLKDPQGVYLMCNPRFERLYGHTEDAIRGKTDYDFVDRPLADFFRDKDRAAIAAGGPTINEEELIFADDGHRELLETIKTPMHDAAGQLIGVLGIGRDVTATRRNQAALRDSETRYRALFEHLQSGFALHEIVTDAAAKPIDYVFLAANDAYGRMTGLEPTRIVGRRVSEVYPQVVSDSTDWIGTYGEVALSGNTIHLERDAEGLQRWYEVTAYQPATRQFAVVVQDITERKLAEAALVASEAHHRTVLAALGEGVYGVDQDGRCTFINAAALHMLGLSEAQVVGQDQHALFHHHWPDGRPYPHSECPIHQTLRDGQVRRQEEWFFRRDGSGFPVELAATPIAAADERVGGVVAFRDISVRRRAEGELRKLSLAVEQSPESVVITDLEARIEYVNEAFLRNTGYRREEVIGRNPRVLQSGQTPAAVYENLWATLTQGQPWRGRFVNQRKDGSEYVEFAHIAPIRQPDGHITHYVAVKEDITERQRIAAELDQHRDHLEELVVKRTEELAQARERAEAASRVKGEFLANMSHEIRTPLNGVLGLAQIGYRASAGRKAQATFARILDSGKLLLGIINDILDFSKIEAGKLKIEAVALNPYALVEHVATLMQVRAQAKNLSLTIDRSPGSPASCLGDPLRIEQILLNLLSNAVKFTERGGVTLGVSRQDGWLVFTVADTGIGMSGEQLVRLFTAFEQADGSTTRRYGGTGLGLTISKRLVDLMGGEIHVDSQVAHGSRFEVRLPLVEATTMVGAPAALSDDIRAAPSGPRLAGIRILVAEDTEINQLVIEEFLTSEGARVVVVGDGGQAVEQVMRDGGAAFDIVLMDIQMPEMDGYEATRKLRRFAPALPVVGQTAHALAEEREKCLAAGMVAHLAKPIDFDELVAVVLRHRAIAGVGTGIAVPTVAPVREAASAVGDDGNMRVDWPALQARFGGSASFIHKLATSLLRGHAETPEKLRQAAQARDLEALAFLTHRLKGVIGNLLLPALFEQATQAEAAVRQQLPDAVSLAEALTRPLEQLLAQARTYLEQGERAAEAESGIRDTATPT